MPFLQQMHLVQLCAYIILSKVARKLRTTDAQLEDGHCVATRPVAAQTSVRRPNQARGVLSRWFWLFTPKDQFPTMSVRAQYLALIVSTLLKSPG